MRASTALCTLLMLKVCAYLRNHLIVLSFSDENQVDLSVGLSRGGFEEKAHGDTGIGAVAFPRHEESPQMIEDLKVDNNIIRARFNQPK